MKNGIIAATLVLVSAGASAAPIGPFSVGASFTPNNVPVGQSTTFRWSAPTGAFCEVEGLPGGSRFGATGTYTFAATGPVTALVSCERMDTFSGKSATLTVTDAVPTVTTGFSPSTIYVGGAGSTFSWSSTNATNCTSPENSSVTGPYGWLSFQPAAGAAQQTITVNCSGAGGSASSAATLTTQVPTGPLPTVSVFASPNYLPFGGGIVNVTYSAQNVTSCQGAGTYYIQQSTYVGVQCNSPNGIATGYAWVKVRGLFGFSSVAPTSAAAMVKDGKPVAAKQAALLPPNLKHLGIDLSKKRYEYTQSDMNLDGTPDLLIVDQLRERAHIVLGKGGQYPSLTKTIERISSVSQIKGVFVPTSNAPGEIRVTLESQQ
jgi:hypothetical protein